MTTKNTLILIIANPSQSLAWHAYRYAKAYLTAEKDNPIESPTENQTEYQEIDQEQTQTSLQIFFYGEAAHTGNALRWQTADRENLTLLWSQLSKEYQLQLPICVSTALTRGITDAANAKRHKLQGNNLAEGFELVGLGELAAQLSKANKVITF